MRLTASRRIVLLAALALVAAGCGSSGATSSPTATTTGTKAAHPKATASHAVVVTAEMAAWAKAVDPVVRLGVSQIDKLYGQINNGSPGGLGDICSTAGGQASQNRDAFSSVLAPKGAKSVSNQAVSAYKLVLGSTDECGIAADDNSSKEMSTARADLQRAQSSLRSAESTLAAWAKH